LPAPDGSMGSRERPHDPLSRRLHPRDPEDRPPRPPRRFAAAADADRAGPGAPGGPALRNRGGAERAGVQARLPGPRRVPEGVHVDPEGDAGRREPGAHGARARPRQLGGGRALPRGPVRSPAAHVRSPRLRGSDERRRPGPARCARRGEPGTAGRRTAVRLRHHRLRDALLHRRLLAVLRGPLPHPELLGPGGRDQDGEPRAGPGGGAPPRRDRRAGRGLRPGRQRVRLPGGRAPTAPSRSSRPSRSCTPTASATACTSSTRT
jgi:hypothetical protein